MRTHWLQHAADEDPGWLLPALRAHHHILSCTRLHLGEPCPALEDFDLLLVMGGPMNIYDDAHHPWLRDEKRLLHRALDSRKRLLGICLGAQLLADQLGGRVSRNPLPEIGWFPVALTSAGREAAAFAHLPPRFTAFHWHEDTYALPPGATQLASSAACAQQAFSWDSGRVLGLQYHPEVTLQQAQSWLEPPPRPGRGVQTAASILANSERFTDNATWCRALLDGLLQSPPP